MKTAGVNRLGDLVCPACGTNIMTPIGATVIPGFGQCPVCRTKFNVTKEVAMIANEGEKVGKAEETNQSDIRHDQ